MKTGTGEEGGVGHWCEEQEAKKMVIPFEKMPKNSGTDRTPSPKEIFPALSNGPSTFECSSKRQVSVSAHPGLGPPNSHAVAWAGPQRQTRNQAREAEVVSPGWEKKGCLAKGMSPTALRAGVNTLATLVENQRPSWSLGRTMWCHRAAPVPQKGSSLLLHQGEGQAGRLVHRRPAPLSSSYRLTWKTRLSWWKLSGPIEITERMTICHHWGGNVLGPKLVPCRAKLEKAKTTKLG